MNKLEKFIVQNRELLDTENIPESVWEKIQLPVDASKPSRSKAFIKPLFKWSIAAISTGVIFSGIYLFNQKSKPSHNTEHSISANIEQPKSNINDSSSTEEIKKLSSKQASEVEEIYQTVLVKQTELKNVASINPELYRQFASDLATLDSSYHMLKSQANSSPNQDVIIKAMIQNLELQAELLSRQLLIIHQFKKLKNESYETSNNKRDI